jgi:hypothetical protein
MDMLGCERAQIRGLVVRWHLRRHPPTAAQRNSA